LAGDLSEQEQKVVWATHFAPAADLFDQKLDSTAWRSKPSWYIMVTSELRASRAATLGGETYGATTYEADSSHVPMLSNPSLVIDVICTAANAVQKSNAG
jgi:hypothetical protein